MWWVRLPDLQRRAFLKIVVDITATMSEERVDVTCDERLETR